MCLYIFNGHLIMMHICGLHLKYKSMYCLLLLRTDYLGQFGQDTRDYDSSESLSCEPLYVTYMYVVNVIQVEVGITQNRSS